MKRLYILIFAIEVSIFGYSQNKDDIPQEIKEEEQIIDSVKIGQNISGNFIDNSSLIGNVFFWERHRVRKNINTYKFENDITQLTFNANLDYKSGYLWNVLGVELGGYGALELNSSGNSHPNEIAFSKGKTRWGEEWDKDESGVSFYKAQLNFRIKNLFWLRAGYIQPSGQTLLAPHWSLLPGTYRGFETGTVLDLKKAGILSMSYMWADRYKAPWYRNIYDFRRGGVDSEKINYLHSAGFKYDFKNNLLLEGAFGQAEGFINQYFGKISYLFNIAHNPLGVSYHFYGSKDQDHEGENIYNGLAWLQALNFSYKVGPVSMRLEGVMVKADGEQGFFLQRMTPAYASSNGRMDFWWNSRSDFNANGEKAVFGLISYDLGTLVSELDGWRVALSGAYAWGAKPSSNPIYDQNQRVKESAWNVDLAYVVTKGWAKDVSFNLHYTSYNNHSNNPSWGGGYKNMYQSERDVKFFVVVPFTVFSPVKKIKHIKYEEN